MLKLSYTQCQSKPGKQETHVDGSHRQSSLVSSEGEQGVTINFEILDLFSVSFALEIFCLVFINFLTRGILNTLRKPLQRL